MEDSQVVGIVSAFRVAIDFRFTLAISLRAWRRGHQRLSLLFLVAFHCLLRPGEMVELRWNDLVVWDEIEAARFHDTCGFVRVRKPKTRRMAGHAAVQHVLLEDPGLASFLAWAISTVPVEQRGRRIWSQPQYKMAAIFSECCEALGLAHLHLSPAGLRGGGATDTWVRTRDVPGIRREGRWTSEKTLERYLQEGTALYLRSNLHPDTRALVDREAAVATELCVLLQQRSPPAFPPSTPPPPSLG